jgi:hypothetical protein
MMPRVKDRLKIGQERGCIRCCKDDFEYFDLMTKRLWAKIPLGYRHHATFYTDQYVVMRA